MDEARMMAVVKQGKTVYYVHADDVPEYHPKCATCGNAAETGPEDRDVPWGGRNESECYFHEKWSKTGKVMHMVRPHDYCNHHTDL